MSKILFSSDDNKFFVEINQLILENIKIECVKTGNKETGGILIGYYSELNTKATISMITGPPNDSIHSESTFERGINGLNNIIDNQWNSNRYYLGEWHFHPNSSSKPSYTDDLQMKKFANDDLLQCPEPILLIIGGVPDLEWEVSVYVYTRDRKITLLSK